MRVKLFPFQGGFRDLSRPDLVGNILLFVPLGFLASGSGCSAVGRGWGRRICASGLLAMVVSTAIELGQLFSPGRTTSGIDVEANVTGALLGAMGALMAQRSEKRLEACVRLARDRPQLVPAALMAVWLWSNSFYESQSWLDRAVNETVVFAMLTTLVGWALRRYSTRALAAMMAMCASVVF